MQPGQHIDEGIRADPGEKRANPNGQRVGLLAVPQHVDDRGEEPLPDLQDERVLAADDFSSDRAHYGGTLDAGRQVSESTTSQPLSDRDPVPRPGWDSMANSSIILLMPRQAESERATGAEMVLHGRLHIVDARSIVLDYDFDPSPAGHARSKDHVASRRGT